jgi:hypothetical protein
MIMHKGIKKNPAAGEEGAKMRLTLSITTYNQNNNKPKILELFLLRISQ